MNQLASAAPLDALFLSPHPDDVELFCGGTVARLVAQGSSVAILDLTAGERASNGSVEGRRQESLTASRALGLASWRPVLELPDGGVDDGSDEQLNRLVEFLRAARPRVLFAPHPVDRHPDHVAAGKLARRACSLAGRSEYAATGAPHQLDGLYEYPCHQLVPTHFMVEVSDHMDARREAIAAYRSQFVREEGSVETPINQPGFLARNEARVRDWGKQVGVEFAEGFLGEGSPAEDRLSISRGEKQQ